MVRTVAVESDQQRKVAEWEGYARRIVPPRGTLGIEEHGLRQQGTRRRLARQSAGVPFSRPCETTDRRDRWHGVIVGLTAGFGGTGLLVVRVRLAGVHAGVLQHTGDAQRRRDKQAPGNHDDGHTLCHDTTILAGHTAQTNPL